MPPPRCVCPYRFVALAAAILAVAASPVACSATDATSVFQSTGIRRGLFVVVAGDAELAIGLVGAEPVLACVVTAADQEAAVRAAVTERGMHGRVTVVAAAEGRIPLIDGLAAVVVADVAQLPVPREELMRVVRPLGRLHLREGDRWLTTEKPLPEGVDDWPQYHHDAAMTDRSDDLLAGPAHGIQWLAGHNSKNGAKMGVRVVGSTIVSVDDRGVVARDAYSGLPIWRRSDLKPSNRYAFLADDERLFLVPRGDPHGPLPSCMKALRLTTGEDVLAFTEGVRLGWALVGLTRQENKTLERTDRAKARLNRDRASKSLDAVQARLADGVLLQTRHTEMVALEARTGRRLWSQSLTGSSEVTDPRRKTQRMASHAWHHPLVLEGRVYVVEGENTPSWSYTHWPMGAVRAIHCFGLKTGESHWAWRWPEELGRPAAAYNMTPVGDWLGLMLRVRPFEKSAPAVVFVKRDGTSYRHGVGTPYGKEIGGGHSHARLLFVNGQVWVNGTTKPAGTIDLSEPGDRARWGMSYAKLPRPVGCTVSRATPNYVFGSLTTYALDGNAIEHTNAARAVCDVGATPAAGMAFITPTQCFCAPYLPGFKAFHPRPFSREEDFERLDRGTAVPAADTGIPIDWPMYMANARRGNWTGAEVAGTLTRLWSVEPGAEDVGHAITGEWKDNWYTQGPVTPVSIAGGVAVFALTDRQQVVAVDPATGKERWRATVDGRIDTSPTIRAGIVHAGTRSSWLYALNRDTGELLWRFFTAPRRERMLAFGQLESPWPLHGSVLVDDDGVWAVAGRHNDADAGLWWWRLDPLTGSVLANGRLGSDGLSSEVGVRRRSDGRQSGANTVAVSNGKLIFLAGIYLEKRDGGLVDRPMAREEGGAGERKWWTDRFDYDILFPGNQGLVFDYAQMGGYKMPYYGLTQAAVYAYDGRDFLHAGGTAAIQHRGGNAGGRRTTVTRFRKLDALGQVPHPHQEGRKIAVGAEQLWSTPYHESDGTGLGGLAVAGDTVLVGFSVDNRDHWRARKAMAYRLRVLDYETGKRRQDDLGLPAKPVLHGISAGMGRVYVACEDGSIVCFGAVSE